MGQTKQAKGVAKKKKKVDRTRGVDSWHVANDTKHMTLENVKELADSLPEEDGPQNQHTAGGEGGASHPYNIERDTLTSKVSKIKDLDRLKPAAPDHAPLDAMSPLERKKYLIKMMSDETYHGGYKNGIATCWHCKKYLYLSGPHGFTVHNKYGAVCKHSAGLCVLVHPGCNDALAQCNPPTACPRTGKLLSDGRR